MYKLFIDDERKPIGDDWVIARTYDRAIRTMLERGCPSYILFDHDIQCEPLNGKSIANWMVERDMDLRGQWMPANFAWFAHSKNPIGAENINGLLTNYLDKR